MNEYKVRVELDRVEDGVLDLSICNINDKDIKLIKEKIYNSKAKTVKLAYNNITDDGLDELLDYFPTTMEKLDIKGNSLNVNRAPAKLKNLAKLNPNFVECKHTMIPMNREQSVKKPTGRIIAIIGKEETLEDALEKNKKAKDAELKQKREVFIKTTKRAQHTNPALNHLN
ncbi:MAG: hypothetical protein OIF36_04405 [Alphaproteobacteria bacterium]|nr:hypothetical protein [Alphaproteobacteria bacterium]